MSRRVVITGMGVLSPIGNSISEFDLGLRNGQNGIGPITHFDTKDFSVHIAGEVKINLEEKFDHKELNRMDRFSAMAIIASDEAIHQAGIDKNSLDRERIGVIIGSGTGGLATFEEQHHKLIDSPRKVSPFFIPMLSSKNLY